MITQFFNDSDSLDYSVTKKLAHIACNWELTWDENSNQYKPEENSFAKMLNELIKDLANNKIPKNFHENEDIIANHVIQFLNWNIFKEGNRWKGEEYAVILSQGGFHDINQMELMKSAAGRINDAIQNEKFYFDEMEEGHHNILGDILAILLYHRWNGEEF